MTLGTKNRQQQTAEACKQHLRDENQDKLPLVEEFIVEIQGTGKNLNLTSWSRFTDIKHSREEMFTRQKNLEKQRSGERITKTARASRGQEPKWEIPDNI
jgi:hypothetical protein